MIQSWCWTGRPKQYYWYNNYQKISLALLPDGVASLHSHPLRDWPVLLHLLGQLGLDPKGFMCCLQRKEMAHEIFIETGNTYFFYIRLERGRGSSQILGKLKLRDDIKIQPTFRAQIYPFSAFPGKVIIVQER